MKRLFTRVIVATALVTAIAVSVGVSVAHAQGFCYRTTVHFSDVVFGPYGPVYVPCIHWVTVCR